MFLIMLSFKMKYKNIHLVVCNMNSVCVMNMILVKHETLPPLSALIFMSASHIYWLCLLGKTNVLGHPWTNFKIFGTVQLRIEFCTLRPFNLYKIKNPIAEFFKKLKFNVFGATYFSFEQKPYVKFPAKLQLLVRSRCW
jgi:hypothetical protein